MVSASGVAGPGKRARVSATRATLPEEIGVIAILRDSHV